MTDPALDLASLLDHVWARLAQAVSNRADPMRLVALATVGSYGPEVRTVALRRADRAAGEIEIHSDRRTAKVAALIRDPRAAVLLWDPEQELQIRVRATFRLIHGDVERWDEVPLSSRTNYGTDPAPGVAVPDPKVVRRVPDPSRFSALVGAVQAFDVVCLGHDPHRRAQFDGPEGPGRWVAP